jgi:aspartyl-tRNA(Asn)/glutamyl-tRNA(Gln) amidotransferase subunit A
VNAIISACPEVETADGPLSGWRIGVKDNIDVAGTVRTDGLGPPHPAPAETDSVAVARLRAAGAAIVAKTNLEQLSFGATTQNPAFGPCLNPWDHDRIPGGSSGGSAVAVAAGLVDAALGTDTGGSLRNPAAFCGVSALRPTHGLIPMDGITPLSPSLDVVGPMARSVAELSALMAALAGATPEPTTLDGLRVGVPRTYFLDDLDADVARGFDALLELFADVSTVELPVEDVPEAQQKLLNAEAAVSLRDWWDDPRVSDGIRERIDLGRHAGDLTHAHRIAGAWRAAVAAAFETVDVIVTPATPFVAPLRADDNLVRLSRRINRCTGVWSLTGGPALVLPLARDGLPVGGQLIGPPGADRRLLAVGEAIQAVSDWHMRGH